MTLGVFTGHSPIDGGGRVVLIGMMGAGKTTVGRLVADQLGWEFVDTDAEVVASTGHTIAELFERCGEAGFRREESRVLARVLATDRTVLAVGGGTVLDPINAALVRSQATVVWLRASVDTLLRRIGTGAGRPMLKEDPTTLVPRIDSARRPLYKDLAHVTVDVDYLDPTTAAGRVMAYLEHATVER